MPSIIQPVSEHTPSKHSIFPGQVQGSQSSSNLPPPQAQRKPSATDQMLAHIQMIEFENRQLKTTYGWTVRMQEDYLRLVNQNQDLKAALKMKDEELRRVLRYANLRESAFMNIDHHRTTTADLSNVHCGQAPPTNISMVVPQQRIVDPPNVNQVKANQSLVTTVALNQSACLNRQQNQPGALLQRKSQNFLRRAGPDNAYLPSPSTSPEYNYPPVRVVPKNELHTPQKVIDLTSDESGVHPPVTQNAMDATVSNMRPASIEPLSQSSRKHYVPATGPNLGGPKKAPSWVVREQADMKSKARDQATSKVVAEFTKGKRKSVTEDRPSKKAKTRQSRTVTKTASEKSTRQPTKEPRGPCTPKANPLTEHQTVQSQAGTSTEDNGMGDDEYAELQAEIDAELEAEHTGTSTEDNGMGDDEYAELQAEIDAELEAEHNDKAEAEPNAMPQADLNGMAEVGEDNELSAGLNNSEGFGDYDEMRDLFEDE